ncbi:unnamed protein product [Brassicogethes aeneus]|uniref:Uncharacterized protein n=1 Tax=Brassicogethes aeneus TaxID=1431903 RepID=A0A9P0B6I1_BRAAE|nr:unnamed protein product [Brassicogethes aeneus]
MNYYFLILDRGLINGSVKAESFTKLPPPLHPASMIDSQINQGSVDGSDCIPTSTAEEDLLEDDDLNLEEEEESEELLQRLATRHYYSYTAALGVTVGVGCLLLVLNMLIFAGIYYQRERDRRRQNSNRNSRASSSPSTETIPMSQRPSTPGSSARQSPVNHRKEKYEMPPCYNTLARSLSIQDVPQIQMNTLKRDKPPPPVRTSSNPPVGTVKKRVQIQEISV